MPKSPVIPTCIEAGCNELVKMSGGRTYKRCDEHHRQRIAAGIANRSAGSETVDSAPAGEDAPALDQTDVLPADVAVAAETAAPSEEPEPLPYDAAPPVNDIGHNPLPAVVEQAIAVAAEMTPNMLEQLIRQAFVDHPEALHLTVTGFKVAFHGEIEISS